MVQSMRRYKTGPVHSLNKPVSNKRGKNHVYQTSRIDRFIRINLNVSAFYCLLRTSKIKMFLFFNKEFSKIY